MQGDHMGFLDSLLASKQEDSRGETAANDFGNVRLVLRFSPLRLSALKENKVNLVIKVTNDSDKPKLLSLDVLLSKNQSLGFDTTCLSKHIEKKLGELKGGESTEIALPIFASNQTKEGTYGVQVTAYSHYLNYDKVMNSFRKTTSLRVV